MQPLQMGLGLNQPLVRAVLRLLVLDPGSFHQALLLVFDEHLGRRAHLAVRGLTSRRDRRRAARCRLHDRLQNKIEESARFFSLSTCAIFILFILLIAHKASPCLPRLD